MLTVLEGAGRKWVVGSDTGAWGYLLYFSKDLAFLSLLFLPRKKVSLVSHKIFARSLLMGGVLLFAGAGLSSAYDINAVGAILTLRAVLILPIVAYLVLPRIPAISMRVVASHSPILCLAPINTACQLTALLIATQHRLRPT